MLRQHKRRGDINADGLFPFDCRNFCERFHHCDARIVHEQINWFLARLGDQVRDGGRLCQVMNQQDHFRTMWLDGFACLRQSYRIAPMQEEHRIVCGELLSNCTTDSAARACDEITLHGIGRKR
jgi:hypothetical protein